jgi:hypothetical protein
VDDLRQHHVCPQEHVDGEQRHHEHEHGRHREPSVPGKVLP